MFGFLLGIGTKGIVEGELITGEELTTFERSTGWFPIAGKVGRGIKNIRKLSRAGSKLRRGTKILREYRPVIGVVTEGGEHVGDAEDAAKAIAHTDDVAKTGNAANRIVKGVSVSYKGKNVPVYRGGNSFTLKPIDFKINPETGMVKPTRGVSLDIDADAMSRFGGAYQIESLPDGLKIIQRGDRLEHFEIVPSYEMTVDQYQILLNQIKTIPIN